MFGLPTIKSGSTYGTDAEPLGLPMNKRRWETYKLTQRALDERMKARDLDVQQTIQNYQDDLAKTTQQDKEN